MRAVGDVPHLDGTGVQPPQRVDMDVVRRRSAGRVTGGITSGFLGAQCGRRYQGVECRIEVRDRWPSHASGRYAALHQSWPVFLNLARRS